MNEDMLFPPFYIGEKVVAVDALPGSRFKNGLIYTVYSCTYEESGNPISPPGKKYWYVGVVGHPKWTRPSIFASLDSFKEVTFNKIEEAVPSGN